MAALEKMEEICLVDAVTNENFTLIVNRKDATRARNDLTFATQLLQHARQSRNICTSQQASTSSIQQTSTASLDTAVECAEGTHAWTKQETLLLLGLYREHQEKFVGEKGTVKKHWDTISHLMQEKGHYISGFKCSTKLQALKHTYKSIMDHNNKTGNNRKDWEYLQIMQELFDEKPWMQPMAVAGSHLNENENAIDLDGDKENLEKVSVTKKTKVRTLLNDYISFSMEERVKRQEIRTKQHEEKLLAFKKIENILERLTEKEDKSEK
ncbi:uncharacterized protein LOC112588861 [Harpegnathos saltator]|uniref:uncharacterized protein LOC112588861 n=1 Tax=Harpegnathos saltator TaxID=610380 RepID=UPI000DBEDAA5|nr:uncharacterized protein LOC112588861 [Harpegnathos saltator]